MADLIISSHLSFAYASDERQGPSVEQSVFEYGTSMHSMWFTKDTGTRELMRQNDGKDRDEKLQLLGGVFEPLVHLTRDAQACHRKHVEREGLQVLRAQSDKHTIHVVNRQRGGDGAQIVRLLRLQYPLHRLLPASELRHPRLRMEVDRVRAAKVILPLYPGQQLLRQQPFVPCLAQIQHLRV
eukprot:470367-Pyramimonas_sp.AAC.1